MPTKLWELNTIQIQQVSQTQLKTLKSKHSINPQHIFTACRFLIPSELSGPNGQPIATEGTQIVVGAVMLIIEMSYTEFTKQWEQRI